MSKKLTKEEFVQRAIDVHKDRYSYQNVEYVKMLQKVCIICKVHGNFWQTPADHLWNHGCPKCKADKRSFSWVEMLNQFPDKNKNYYAYVKTTYKRNSVKMKMICPKHGEFWQKPELHKNGAGCKICTASGGPGKYCETIFDRKPELKQKPGFLYYIELLDADNTKFYKIGITTSMKNRFYNFIENNHGKVLWIRKDTLYNCFLLEQKILKENTNFLYRPINLSIGGKTECLTKEIIDDF
jgi:hypothetical protein